MENLKKKIQDELDKVWPVAQKNMTKMSKDINKLVAKSEKTVSELYKQTRKKTEELINKAKREELYYELGKNIVPLLTSDQLKNKNILSIYSKLQEISKKLKTRKK